MDDQSYMIMQELFAEIRENCDDYQAVIEILNTLERADTLTYRCEDYVVHDLLAYGLDKKKEILCLLNEKGFTLFPEWLDEVRVGDYMIVLTCIRGMGGQDLLSYENGCALLSSEQREKAYQELKKLADAKLYFPALIRGPWFWRVTVNDSRLVIPDMLPSPMEDEAQREPYLQTCYGLLFRNRMEWHMGSYHP